MTKAYIIQTARGEKETYTTMSFPYPNNANETISIIFNELNQREAIYLELNSEIENKVKDYLDTKGNLVQEINIVIEDAIKSMLDKLRD